MNPLLWFPLFGRRALLAAAVSSCLCLPALRASERIERVLPFVTESSVRVVTRIGAGPDETIDLSGQIVPWKGGPVLWSGSLGSFAAENGRGGEVEAKVDRLSPRLWEPGSPNLYVLTVTAIVGGKEVGQSSVRFGFRSITVRNGQICLNGRPIFLRGLAINPPSRTIPDSTGMSRAFAQDYVRYMRSKNFNLIRMTLTFEPGQGKEWFDACDEQGMLVFQGDYGRPPTAQGERSPPKDFDKAVHAYRSVFEDFVPHPSVVIYILANELPNPTGSAYGWHEFLTKAWRNLQAWDSTRLFIGNAGYGLGGEGDLDDVHRYWGWYYNTFLTYYNLRDPALFGDPKLNQPITFSECVGSFTGPTGEFNDVARKQLLAQQQWTGESSEQGPDALAYQAFLAKEAAESFRRMREINPRLSGLMPFTILFSNWNGITSFAQMGPKPAADALGVAYQPVLLSWELWTPQVYAGTKIRAYAHVMNDSEGGSALKDAELSYRIVGPDGAVVISGSRPLGTIPYYGWRREAIDLELPRSLPTGDYRLEGIVSGGGKTVSHNEQLLFVAGKSWKEKTGTVGTKVMIFDPIGRTAEALAKLGIAAESIPDLGSLSNRSGSLIIGEDAMNAKADGEGAAVRSFMDRGGRVLCLGQDFRTFNGSWLPAPIRMLTTSANDSTYLKRQRPTRDQMYVNPERPEHPALVGLDRTRLRLWSDPSGWDQTRPEFPRIYPVTHGFVLTQADSLARTAIIADYDRGLEGIALCEMFSGSGSVVLSAFDLVGHVGIDPAADRLLMNLVRYVAEPGEHRVHPEVTRPIVWGDYPSQQGVLNGSLQGLYLGTEWVVPPTNPHAKPLKEGSWNMAPGDQMKPHGVQPRGPIQFGTSSTEVDLDPENPIGSGFFWASLPPGKTEMVNRIHNPTSRVARLEIAVNGSSPAAATTLEPGKTTEVVTPIAGDSSDVRISYRGERDLLILETSFR